MNEGKLVCRDITPQRLKRLNRMLLSYLPQQEIEKKVIVELNVDALKPNQMNLFDKVSWNKEKKFNSS